MYNPAFFILDFIKNLQN